MNWGRYLALGVVAIAIVVAIAWEPSPSVRAGIGWFLVVIGSVSFVAMLIKRPPANAAVPRWAGPLSGVTLILMGMAGLWPNALVPKLWIPLALGDALYDVVRRYRKTNGDSII